VEYHNFGFASPNVSPYPNKVGIDLQQNHGSSVGVASGYGADDREAGVRVPSRSRIFFSPCRSEGSGAHPASYSMDTGHSFAAGAKFGRK
jgi:hypothetical protein